MRLLLATVLALAACGPPPDCVTPGGLAVVGYECEAVGALQGRIEAEAEALGLGAHALRGVTLVVRTEGLDAGGGWYAADLGYSVRERAHCGFRTFEVAVGPLDRPDLKSTSLAHGAFHVAQGCPRDARIESACRQEGGSEGDCFHEATHPGWLATVYPAVGRVNAR